MRILIVQDGADRQIEIKAMLPGNDCTTVDSVHKARRVFNLHRRNYFNLIIVSDLIDEVTLIASTLVRYFRISDFTGLIVGISDDERTHDRMIAVGADAVAVREQIAETVRDLIEHREAEGRL